MTLLICRTCPRYDPRATGEFGRCLTTALVQITEDEPDSSVAVRNVQCLGGCPDDGVVAVDGPGKTRVRFTGLDETDAKAVHAAAVAHDACVTGAPEDWEIPAELADRVSSVTANGPPARRPAPPSALGRTRLSADRRAGGSSTPTGAEGAGEVARHAARVEGARVPTSLTDGEIRLGAPIQLV